MLDKAIGNMAGMPSGAELDMNNVTLRISLDVTGIVGFAKDFRTCASFKDAGTDELFTIIQKSKLSLYRKANVNRLQRVSPCNRAFSSPQILKTSVIGWLLRTAAATSLV